MNKRRSPGPALLFPPASERLALNPAGKRRLDQRFLTLPVAEARPAKLPGAYQGHGSAVRAHELSPRSEMPIRSTSCLQDSENGGSGGSRPARAAGETARWTEETQAVKHQKHRRSSGG